MFTMFTLAAWSEPVQRSQKSHCQRAWARPAHARWLIDEDRIGTYALHPGRNETGSY